MKKIDIHVHSKYSDNPSEWLFKKIGTRESYTEIDEVYRLAKQQGMDFVTITDHDTLEGSLKLVERYPNDTFTGVEVTTSFPEDGCKIHLLVYDITLEQFQLIDQLRCNIYRLRDYLKKTNVPYSVAHATYAVNGKLNVGVLEKLILLFDVFEGINGARNGYFNTTWTQTLCSLQPAAVEKLYKKHGIEPISETPWIKGFTGGSDDHSALFIGRTWTHAPARTVEEFLEQLRNKKTLAAGRSNDYKSMAFILCKIAHEFLENEFHGKPNLALRTIARIVFDQKPLRLKDAYLLHKLKKSRREKDQIIFRMIKQLRQDFVPGTQLPSEEKVDFFYKNVAGFCDDFIKMGVEEIQKMFAQGKLGKFNKLVSNWVPVTLLTTYYYGMVKHLNKERVLVEKLRTEYLGGKPAAEKKVLWFTDTIGDLNGVSVTLKNVLACASSRRMNLKVVVCSPGLKEESLYPANIINLPSIDTTYTPEFYTAYTMRFPSLLKSLERIVQENPTEIIISTPGPLGTLGMLVARIMGIKCSGIYHSDFRRQLDFIMGDGYLPAIVGKYTSWFYGHVDEIKVPTRQYIRILSDEEGFPVDKMSIFKRGVDTGLFNPRQNSLDDTLKKYGIKEGFNLIYAGRVSFDKSVDFLSDVYKKIVQSFPDTNLIIAGKGPAYRDLKRDLQSYPRAIFTGQVDAPELARLYAASNLFVFPSTTDTFGMVVLESQASGLPVLVSDRGGPQDIIEHGKTGFILPARELTPWIKKITEIMDVFYSDRSRYEAMRGHARDYILRNFSWEEALNDIMGHPAPDQSRLMAHL